jgi:hypothetical protein
MTRIDLVLHCAANSGVSLSHSPALSSMSILQNCGQFNLGSVRIPSIHAINLSTASLRTDRCTAATERAGVVLLVLGPDGLQPLGPLLDVEDYGRGDARSPTLFLGSHALPGGETALYGKLCSSATRCAGRQLVAPPSLAAIIPGRWRGALSDFSQAILM